MSQYRQCIYYPVSTTQCGQCPGAALASPHLWAVLDQGVAQSAAGRDAVETWDTVSHDSYCLLGSGCHCHC